MYDVEYDIVRLTYDVVGCTYDIVGRRTMSYLARIQMDWELFEINMWMWRYGRTFPRQISVDQAVELRKKRVQESRARGAETLRRRRDAAWVKGASAPQ